MDSCVFVIIVLIDSGSILLKPREGAEPAGCWFMSRMQADTSSQEKSETFLLSCFILPRLRFFSMRLLLAESVGRVSLRTGRLCGAPCLINSLSLSSASWRLSSLDLKRWAFMTSTPSLVTRLSRSFSRRCLYSSGREDAGISKRRCMALETLFTFCPPGPPDLTASMVISDSGMAILGEILNTDF